MMQPRFRLVLASTLAVLATVPLFAETAPRAMFQDTMAQSAVKWDAWGSAAFARARSENKPIYLHIGSFTSELSRAMARQSFANAEVAKFLNDSFVCVLVDRDRQPDVAALFRAYVHTAKQLDGTPLNVFLTPELKPFEGSTYLPPSEEWGKPGLMNVARQVAGAWQSDANAQRQKGNDAAQALAAAEALAAPPMLDRAALGRVLADNIQAWTAKYDAENGGFGDPPKRLEPELLRALLVDPATRPAALKTLGAMANGAIRDPLDGGFFRQTMDPQWRQPNFQRSTADQARIALAYLDAAKLDADPLLAAAARGALRYVWHDVPRSAQGFAEAQETDAAGVSFYLWTLDEFQAVLGEKDGTAFAATLGVTAAGNIPDDTYTGVTTAKHCVVYRATPYTAAAEKSEQAWRAKLLAARARRPQPTFGPAANAGVHGVLLAAFSRAGTELGDADLRAAADATWSLLQQAFRAADGSLLHLAGEPTLATPADLALVIAGVSRYATATKNAAAAKWTADLEHQLETTYWDATAGRYFALPAQHPAELFARVHVPNPVAGELPAPEAVMLFAQPNAARAPLLARALGVEVRDSTEAPAGELLLALRTYLDATK